MTTVVLTWALTVLTLLITVCALPPLRVARHDLFEATHRAGGWITLALFWPLTVEAALSRPTRGPGAVFVAVLLIAAVTGALTTPPAAARVAARTALLGLSASAPILQGLQARSSPQDDAPAKASMVLLTLDDRGEEDLQVQVTGISPPAGLGAGGVEVITVPADGARVVTLPPLLDCAAAPGGAASADAEDQPRPWVDITATGRSLDPAGGATRLPLPDGVSGFTSRLALLCDPAAFCSAIGEPLEVREDGALLVQLTNDEQETVELLPRGAPGVDLVLDPSLEGGLPTAASVEVALVLEVDCAATGDLLTLPSALELGDLDLRVGPHHPCGPGALRVSRRRRCAQARVAWSGRRRPPRR